MLAIVLKDGEVLKLTNATVKLIQRPSSIGILVTGFYAGESYHKQFNMDEISAIIPIERR